MRFRNLIFTALVIALAAVGVFALSPVETANACLPCDCPSPNPPVNCYGPYSLFVHRYQNGGFDIEIMRNEQNGSRVDGRTVIYLTRRELAQLPAEPAQHTLVEQYFEIALYKLSYGDYQINVGPDEYGTVHVVIFDGENGLRLEETSFKPLPQ